MHAFIISPCFSLLAFFVVCSYAVTDAIYVFYISSLNTVSEPLFPTVLLGNKESEVCYIGLKHSLSLLASRVGGCFLQSFVVVRLFKRTGLLCVAFFEGTAFLLLSVGW